MCLSWFSLFLQNHLFYHELLPLLASLLISLPQMEAHHRCPPLSYTLSERKLVYFGPTQPETPPSSSLLLLEQFPGRERRWAQIRGLYLGPIGRRVKFKVKVWHGGPSACSACSLPPSPPPDARLRLSPRSPCPWAHSWRHPLLRL